MMFGDLKTTDIEQRLNITLSDTDRDKLEGMRQSKANGIIPGKWHCFDMPLQIFQILCGDKDTAVVVYDILAPYKAQMKGNIVIGWV